MALHLIFVAMLVAAILSVLVPLARGPRRADTTGTSLLDLHRLRLAEIARDLERGLLDEASAEAARNEAARLLLRSVDAAKPGSASRDRKSEPTRATPWRRRIVALVALFGVPSLVLPLYAVMGSPGLPARAFAPQPQSAAGQDLATLIGQIEAHLVEHPQDGKGFEVLAPIYMRLGRYGDALRARTEAMRLLGETPDRLADLAEARIAVADGVVTREAGETLDKALALEPKQAKARFLKAIGLEQDGRHDDAVAALRAMLADAPADVPWRAGVEAHLARLMQPEGEKAAGHRGLATRGARRCDPLHGGGARRALEAAGRLRRGMGEAGPLLERARRGGQGTRGTRRSPCGLARRGLSRAPSRGRAGGGSRDGRRSGRRDPKPAVAEAPRP